MDKLVAAFTAARTAAGDAIGMLKHHAFQALLDAIGARLDRLEQEVGLAPKSAAEPAAAPATPPAA